jgi:hypothetical protein
MRFEKCCYRNCSPGKDRLCPENAEGKSTGVCHKIENTLVTLEDKSIIREPIRKGVEALDFNNIDKVELDAKLDPFVLVDLKVIEGSSTTCPDLYEFIMCYSIVKKCDLNDSLIGNNIYVCAKYAKHTKTKSQPINAIQVSRFNNDCGTLMLARTNIQKS